jgi:hypothetical protein
MSGTITVRTFGETTKAKAERDLRQQLKDQAQMRGYTLIGRPDLDVEEKMAGWWNGTGSQDYKE